MKKQIYNLVYASFLGVSFASCSNHENVSNMYGGSNIKTPVLVRYATGDNNESNLRDLSRKNGILVGGTGEGKTTLYNKLTNSVAKSGEGSHGITINLFKDPVAYGNNKFDLVDTPGLDDLKDSFTPSYLVRKTLETVPYNTIFVVIAFKKRFDKIVDYFVDISRPLKSYMDKVTIMISHCDESKDILDSKGKIVKEFDDFGIKNQIIFYSCESNTADIANAMFFSLNQMPARLCKFSETDFHKYFNMKAVKDNLKKPYKMFEQRLQDEYRAHINVAKENSQKNDLDEIQHFLLVHFKGITNKLEDDLIKEYGKAMQEYEDYRFFIDLKAKCMFYVNELETTMESISGDSMTDRMLKKMLKKCPYCGVIWSKVATDGCDGRTTCGRRGMNVKDIDPNVFVKLKGLYNNDNFIVGVEVQSKQDPKAKSWQSANEEKTKLGCGRDFYWSGSNQGDIKVALPLSREEMKRYREFVPDEVITNIIEQEKYKYDKQIEEKKIDTNFHSARQGGNRYPNDEESPYTRSFIDRMRPWDKNFKK